MSAARGTAILAALVILGMTAAAYGQTSGSVSGVSAPGHAHAGGPETPQEPAPGSPPGQDHVTHDTPGPAPAGLPPITDEDRRAAFPDLASQHTVHDEAVHAFVLLDHLEWHIGKGRAAGSWKTRGWIGRDVNRFWFRTDGEAAGGGEVEAEAHALFGRAIHPWWDLVGGLRQDFGDGPARTWAAVGIQGLAPYWFEIEATAYIGESGRTHLRLESEYELLFTNRLILQPSVEVDIYGRSDPGRGIGAGLSTLDTGVRLRYEIRREFAPYVGLTWNRAFFGTAERAEAAGTKTSGTRLAVGLRVWF